MLDVLKVRRSMQPGLFNAGRLLVWFSCGAASAVALKLVAHLNPLAIYCDTSKDEHSDNARFRKDVERWTGIPVTIIRSKEYTSVEEVWDARQFMSGPGGAPCTVEMKKVPRFQFQDIDDIHVFGYTTDEIDRLNKFELDNHELNLAWPLIQAGMTKDDCLRLIADAGIEIPIMYRLGFKNNNCLGCVKATSKRYWNMIRKYFPDVFQRRCEQSRRIGAKLVRHNKDRIFLDELALDDTDDIVEDLSCGPQCKPSP